MHHKDSFVKTEFDFGWKKYEKYVPSYAQLALQYQKGSVLDVGCGTCELYYYLKQNGWNHKYYGIDAVRYPGYIYPADIQLIIGDAYKEPFPSVDTAILNNVLEHVDDPAVLIEKSLKCSRENVLINVPKRNEELWGCGVVEYHQLDKTHKHNGFSKAEIYALIDATGGIIRTYEETMPVDATVGRILWKSRIQKGIIWLMNELFPSQQFNQEIWCEVTQTDACPQ